MTFMALLFYYITTNLTLFVFRCGCLKLYQSGCGCGAPWDSTRRCSDKLSTVWSGESSTCPPRTAWTIWPTLFSLLHRHDPARVQLWYTNCPAPGTDLWSQQWTCLADLLYNTETFSSSNAYMSLWGVRQKVKIHLLTVFTQLGCFKQYLFRYTQDCLKYNAVTF